MNAGTFLRRWLPLLLLYGLGVIMLWGYVTDDTWIHLRYAEHLRLDGEMAFNPGDATYGATSPLWVLGLTALRTLGVEPWLSAKLLGVLCGLLLIALAMRVVRTLPVPDHWRGWIMLLVVMDAWFQRWALSGMETPLAGALLLVLLAPAFTTGPVPWLAWGAAAGLASLVRPEYVLLSAAALPWLLWRERGDRPDAPVVRGALLAFAGWALAYGPWLAYAWQAFGRLTPETAAAKSYGLTYAPAYLAAHLFRTLRQLGAVQGYLWLGAVYLFVRWLADWRKTGVRLAPDRRLLAASGLVLSWVAVLAGGYAVKQVWIISRYVSPLLPPLLFVLAGWYALTVVRFGDGRRRAEQALLACAVLAVAANALILSLKVKPHAESFSHGVETCFYGMGECLREATPPDAVIAAHDIGALGYASERRILDLAGLVSPEILELGRAKGFEVMVADGDWLTAEVPDYVFDRTQGPARWIDAVMHGVRFTPVASCVVDGVGLREDDPWTYTLYRLSDAEAPPPADVLDFDCGD